ncbi:ribosomal 40S subunit protein S10A [Perkinsus olseni]|uniref:Ribosomal 40S subunit protein S10A n=2 Tax=Perkinsus olseni TaxID=32597 RepID=A0A7J6LI45_PEROL|nr:ribosomal 40S subunit protein S10A [Perkinsus olseni]
MRAQVRIPGDAFFQKIFIDHAAGELYLPSPTLRKGPYHHLSLALIMVLIRKEDRRTVYEHLFKEGVIVVEKKPTLKHHRQMEVANLHVLMIMKSLSSKDLVDEKFNWQWHYYTLNDDGIEYLRQYLHLPATAFPDTMTKQRPTRAIGGDDEERKPRRDWGGNKWGQQQQQQKPVEA